MASANSNSNSNSIISLGLNDSEEPEEPEALIEPAASAASVAKPVVPVEPVVPVAASVEPVVESIAESVISAVEPVAESVAPVASIKPVASVAPVAESVAPVEPVASANSNSNSIISLGINESEEPEALIEPAASVKPVESVAPVTSIAEPVIESVDPIVESAVPVAEPVVPVVEPIVPVVAPEQKQEEEEQEEEEEEEEEEYRNQPNNELLKLWESETNFKKRDKILVELKNKNLFPSMATSQWDIDTGAYPDITDPEFLQKLLAKREFADSLQSTWKPKTDPCNDESPFEVTPVQRFITNFMSPKTPYMSALLYHGVGVGKTCAAVQVSEAWLEFFPNDQVIIVAPPTIQKGFYRTIFDISKVTIGEENEPNSASQCTGTTYMKLTNTLYERNSDKIVYHINRLIKKRYKIFGYISFANYIRDLTKIEYEGLSNERKEQIEKERIRKYFSGKLLIVDEAHNLRDIEDGKDDKSESKSDKSDSEAGKMLTPYLKNILKYSEGMKFCALTATPMYNTYLEIIFMFNILLMNDKKALIRQNDIFDSTGKIIPKGKQIIADIASHYVSFMRGENPKSFPIRLFPQLPNRLDTYPSVNPRGVTIALEDREYYTHLPIVPIVLKGDLLDATIAFTADLTPPGQGKGGLSTLELGQLVAGCNFIVPVTPSTQGVSVSKYRARTDITSLETVFTKDRRNKETSYRSKIGNPTWLLDTEIGNYSPKFEFLLNHLRNTEGCVFVFSRFVNGGAIPLALALEANGYTHYNRKENLLVDADKIRPRGRQCAFCSKKEFDHGTISNNAASHVFTPAKYGILTGDIDISPNNEETIKAQRHINNKDGGTMKIIIGSQIASEGVDLRFVRETHLIDAWYHLNKTEQIFGRSIRYLSHCALEESKRNNTVYLYTTYIPDGPYSNYETADLYSYRIGYKKAVNIGNVTRIMKQSSLDCNLNLDAIIIKDEGLISQVDSQRRLRRDVNINDMPFTAICDWLETCEYKCNPEINVKDSKKDESTYDAFSARWRIHQVKERIKNIFLEQSFIQSENMWDILADVPRIASVNVLNEITNNKQFQVRHNNLKGYIRYCNGYYIFQPNIYEDLSIPLAIRSAQFPIKRDEYLPITYEIPTSVKEEKIEAIETIEVIWSSVCEWVEQISLNEYSEPPNEMDQWIDILSHQDAELRDKYFQIVEIIEWFHTSFYKSNTQKYNSFYYTILYYLWDEWLNIEEQKLLSGLPDNAQFIKENQYTFKQTIVNRFIDPKTNTIQFMCNEQICSQIIIDQIKDSTTDTLTKIKVDKRTTGALYGFTVPKNGYTVFKIGEPPSVDNKVTSGKECGIVSKIAGHNINLIRLGDILERNGYTDFDLNNIMLYSERKIKNSNRACTLLDLLLRFMNEEKIEGKKWFYRGVVAFYTGHKGFHRRDIK